MQKVRDINDLNKAVYFVVNFFNLQSQIDEADDDFSIEDWKIFSRYEKINDIDINTEKIELPLYDELMLRYFPQPLIIPWLKEGITKDVCDYMGIRYNPENGVILIPHKDENGRLIGIRQRTLVQEDEKYGKYRPTKIQNQLCNHPLAFNLYGLDKAKNNIKDMGAALVVESEKSVLQFMSYFGTAADICVAVCGSSLSKYQFQLLLDAGAKEIIIGFDKDFDEIGTEEYNKVVDKLQKIYDKYSPYVNISFLFDKENNQLGYKDSPLDCGKEKFLYLFRNRVIL